MVGPALWLVRHFSSWAAMPKPRSSCGSLGVSLSRCSHWLISFFSVGEGAQDVVGLVQAIHQPRTAEVGDV